MHARSLKGRALQRFSTMTWHVEVVSTKEFTARDCNQLLYNHHLEVLIESLNDVHVSFALEMQKKKCNTLKLTCFQSTVTVKWRLKGQICLGEIMFPIVHFSILERNASNSAS